MLDPESLRRDGVIRIIPVLEDQPSVSQLWEVTLPS